LSYSAGGRRGHDHTAVLLLHVQSVPRDRTINLQGRRGYGCLLRSEIFVRTTRELEHLIFFQNLTLGYMTKTLNQIFFFFPAPKSEYFFQQYWVSEYFF